ncbi:MAG: cation transporter [Acholeplasmataceae bacterium]|nr:heavy-metal-associated domain-containing protein [Acholeplasmataceae bacterium]
MKLQVENMTCNHCVMKIQKSLLIHGVEAKVSLDEHAVILKSEKDLEKAKKAIKEAGYEVKA